MSYYSDLIEQIKDEVKKNTYPPVFEKKIFDFSVRNCYAYALNLNVSDRMQRVLYPGCISSENEKPDIYSEKMLLERLEKVSEPLILKWIKKFGKIIKERLKEEINNIPDDIKELKEKKNIEVLEGDELRTYIKKNLKMGENKYGYGYLLTETEIKLLIFK